MRQRVGVSALGDFLKVLVAVVVLAAAYGLGKQSAENETYRAFKPNFGDGPTESHKCLAILERRQERTVFAGCKSEHVLREAFETTRDAGIPWPYKVVAEFDRELDN